METVWFVLLWIFFIQAPLFDCWEPPCADSYWSLCLKYCLARIIGAHGGLSLRSFHLLNHQLLSSSLSIQTFLRKWISCKVLGCCLFSCLCSSLAPRKVFCIDLRKCVISIDLDRLEAFSRIATWQTRLVSFFLLFHTFLAPTIRQNSIPRTFER